MTNAGIVFPLMGNAAALQMAVKIILGTAVRKKIIFLHLYMIIKLNCLTRNSARIHKKSV